MVVEEMKTYQWVVTVILVLSSGSRLGYEFGVRKTYQKFISEECWIGKQTRDIICIEYID